MINTPLNLFKHTRLLIWLFLLFRLPHTIKVVWYYSTCILEWVLIVSSTPIIFTVVADPIGMMFASVVLFISANVLSFSTIYIKEEKFKTRFTVLVLLFVLSINLLIFIPHFIILLLGWDGLGIVSFILVIYYQNPKSLAAGIITALTNRVGDVLLLVSIGLTLTQGHWLILNIWHTSISYIQIMCITLAAITKRAQIPFSSWLPAAMAAPTPVSALVHSSTLVTAGVFLLIRFYSFLHSYYLFNTFILIIAVTTMFIAGMRATTECDAKKIIALSTLRQLGIIITSLGFNLPNLAFFHMLTHALFKALLFICAGSFIGTHLHTQDLRWMGNITNQIPVATRCVTLANIALCGFPFISGFYSKDIIIEAAINSPNNILMLFIVIIRLGLTSFYSIRFSITTMWGPSLISPWLSLNEEKNIILPIVILSVISICWGRIIFWLPPVSSSFYILPSYLKWTPLTMVIIGVILAFYITSMLKTSKANSLQNTLNHYSLCSIWFLVPLSSQFILKFPIEVAHLRIKYVDQGWLEISSGLNLNKNLIHITNISARHIPKRPNIYVSTFVIVLLMLLIIEF